MIKVEQIMVCFPRLRSLLKTVKNICLKIIYSLAVSMETWWMESVPADNCLPSCLHLVETHLFGCLCQVFLLLYLPWQRPWIQNVSIWFSSVFMEIHIFILSSCYPSAFGHSLEWCIELLNVFYLFYIIFSCE